MQKKNVPLWRSIKYPPLRYFVVLAAAVSSFVFNHASCCRKGGQQTTSEASVQICFAPEGDCMRLILSKIHAAQKRIFVQAYLLTSQKIADALIAKHRQNLEVRLLIDRGAVASRGSKIPLLVRAGIPICIDNAAGLAHNKIMILDDVCVLTGSFNWTDSAQFRNAENLVVLRGKAHCSPFLANWHKRLAAGAPLSRYGVDAA